MASKGRPKRQAAGDVSATVAKRIKDLRLRRTLTAQQLAERCQRAGMPDMTAQAVSNIKTGRPDEHGRRRRLVTVDELLVLAYVLDVAPVHLLVPTDDDVAYPVAPGHVEPSQDVREWVRGHAPLPGTDLRDFLSTVPQHEFGKAEPTAERLRWERTMMRYLLTAVGRADRREDGALVFEWVRREGEGDDG